MTAPERKFASFTDAELSDLCTVLRRYLRRNGPMWERLHALEWEASLEQRRRKT